MRTIGCVVPRKVVSSYPPELQQRMARRNAEWGGGWNSDEEFGTEVEELQEPTKKKPKRECTQKQRKEPQEPTKKKPKRECTQKQRKEPQEPTKKKPKRECTQKQRKEPQSGKESKESTKEHAKEKPKRGTDQAIIMKGFHRVCCECTWLENSDNCVECHFCNHRMCKSHQDVHNCLQTEKASLCQKHKQTWSQAVCCLFSCEREGCEVCWDELKLICKECSNNVCAQDSILCSKCKERVCAKECQPSYHQCVRCKQFFCSCEDGCELGEGCPLERQNLWHCEQCSCDDR